MNSMFSKICAACILGLSILANGYQFYEIDRLKENNEVLTRKDSFMQSGYDELIISHLNDIRQNQIELAKGQGRIEGITSVIHNFKPEDNAYSEIFHKGYYNGLK